MFLGGLGLFMYGVATTSDGLQKFAANRLKQVLHSLTKRTFLAVLLGMVMTVAFQSSAATTVLVVEFVNAGLINLAQALGIVLGSAVGTSITIQLIAFKILDVALGAIFVGFILLLFKKGQWRHLGQALTGFGIIFVGMANMSAASAPLKNIPAVYQFLAHLAEQPLVAIVVGLILTAVIQSTPAVFAIIMSLAGHHLLSISAVVPLVLGAHTGGTMTTLLSSLTTAKTDAKRTAIANTAYKVIGTILVYPFLPQFARLVQWTTSNVERQVANAHLLFAVFMVIIFLPFNNLVAKALIKLMPERVKDGTHPEFVYIDESSSEVPTVALKQARREIQGLGDLIHDKMFGPMLQILDNGSTQGIKVILQAEQDVDWYYRHISRFLADLVSKGLTDQQAEETLHAQFVLKELEYTGDVFVIIVQLVDKLYQAQMNFSSTQLEQLKELYGLMRDNFCVMLETMAYWDKALAEKVIKKHDDITKLQRALQLSTIAQSQDAAQDGDFRAEEKVRYAIVDLGNSFYNIDEHSANIANVVLGVV